MILRSALPEATVLAAIVDELVPLLEQIVLDEDVGGLRGCDRPRLRPRCSWVHDGQYPVITIVCIPRPFRS